jgi:hypothetical protein
VPVRHGRIRIASVGVSPPNFFFLHRSPDRAGLDPGAIFLPDIARRYPGYVCEANLSEEPRRAPPPVSLRAPFRAYVTVACHSSDAKSHRENEIVHL